MAAFKRSALLTLAATLAATAFAGNAQAENPVNFFQRMLEPTLQELKMPAAQRFVKNPAPVTPQRFVKPADTPLVAVPMPHLRPDDDSAPDVAGTPETAMSFLPDATRETAIPFPTDAIPAPRLRPTISTTERPRIASVLPQASAPKLTEPPPAARATCGVSLAMLGVTAVPLEEIEQGACGIAAPVEVASLDGGAINITGKAVVNCQVAETLATWISNEVNPAAQRTLGGKVTNLRVAAGYACRGRNNIKGAKLSEHGSGNAIDIGAIEIAGHGWVMIGKAASSAERTFLADIRKAACGPFTTVLGPGSDKYHHDHFHLDLAQRSTRGKSRGLYCR